MIINQNIDIFKCNAEAMVHCANTHCTFGSGIAKQIKERYPEAYAADCQTIRGDKSKLGTFSWVKAKDGKYIYNLYGQADFGRGMRQLNYEAFYTGLESIKKHIEEHKLTTLSLPFHCGADRAGGNWHIINAMIESLWLNDLTTTIYICKYTPEIDF